MGYRRYKGNQEQGKKEKANHKPWNNASQKQIADYSGSVVKTKI